MTATAKIAIQVKIEDLATSDEDVSISFTHNITPTEILHSKALIGETTANLSLGNITDTDLLGILIIATGTADTDYLGILVDDTGSGTPSAAFGNQTLNAGEGVYLNFGGSTQGLTSGSYIRVTGAAATTGVEYFAFGK